jgi:ABC-type multidrug transport system fused ATPase/permease subunit
VVLLDEATSALDTLTENSIQEALVTLGKNRTVLVIAHRLSTIAKADQIIVLKAGQVVEQGTHDELLRLPAGEYARMWAMQTKASSNSLDGLGVGLE